MTNHPHFDDESLSAELGLVRSLAARVARDAHTADDLTQEALLIGLGRSTSSSSRGWWAKVVRNLGLTEARGARRRTRREQQVARPEATPSTCEQVERDADRRHLIEAVSSLAEPYRTTLRLRFLEGLTAREVARRMESSESTIATHTSDGLRKLRNELGGASGRTSRTWLAPLCFPFQRLRDVPARAALTGTLAMSGSMKLLVAGLALVAVPFAFRGFDQDRPPLSASDPEALEPRTEVALVLPSLPAPEQVERVDAIERPAPDAALVHPERPAPHFVSVRARGRVIDLEGHTIPGVELCCTLRSVQWGGYDGSLLSRAARAESTDCVTSDGLGEFEIEHMAPFTMRVRSERYATVYEARVTSEEQGEAALVIVAPRVQLGGRVVNERGDPVPNAHVTVHPGSRLLELPGNLLASSDFTSPSARTDASGAFVFEEMPDLNPAQLFVSAAGFRRAHVEFPAGGSPNIEVVLQRAEPSATTLTGRVSFADGTPAPGAWVSAGSSTVRTDSEGLFALDVALHSPWHESGPDAEFVVFAVMEGYLPGSATSPSIAEVEESGERLPLVLELGGSPLSLAGRVVDAEGKPLGGLEVRLVDSTRFGFVPDLFYEFPGGADADDLELVVARLCWLQVDRGDLPPGLVELRIVDEEGQPLDLVSMEGNSLTPRTSIQIGDGLSGVYAISDSATEAVLWRGEEQVARYPIRPTAAEVLLLRL